MDDEGSGGFGGGRSRRGLSAGNLMGKCAMCCVCPKRQVRLLGIPLLSVTWILWGIGNISEIHRELKMKALSLSAAPAGGPHGLI